MLTHKHCIALPLPMCGNADQHVCPPPPAKCKMPKCQFLFSNVINICRKTQIFLSHLLPNHDFIELVLIFLLNLIIILHALCEPLFLNPLFQIAILEFVSSVPCLLPRLVRVVMTLRYLTFHSLMSLYKLGQIHSSWASEKYRSEYTFKFVNWTIKLQFLEFFKNDVRTHCSHRLAIKWLAKPTKT